jgi:hypothetical protein
MEASISDVVAIDSIFVDRANAGIFAPGNGGIRKKAWAGRAADKGVTRLTEPDR